MSASGDSSEKAWTWPGPHPVRALSNKHAIATTIEATLNDIGGEFDAEPSKCYFIKRSKSNAM